MKNRLIWTAFASIAEVLLRGGFDLGLIAGSGGSGALLSVVLDGAANLLGS